MSLTSRFHIQNTQTLISWLILHMQPTLWRQHYADLDHANHARSFKNTTNTEHSRSQSHDQAASPWPPLAPWMAFVAFCALISTVCVAPAAAEHCLRNMPSTFTLPYKLFLEIFHIKGMFSSKLIGNPMWKIKRFPRSHLSMAQIKKAYRRLAG